MILSTLDINEKSIRKMVKVYIIATIFCFIFSFVYLKLSYGVVSYYMKYLSLIPLILGVLAHFILSKLNLKYSRISYNLYNASIFTMIVGSAVQGILEICGGHSFYTKLYLIVGIILVIISIFELIKINIKK